MTSGSTQQIDALTGIRGVAALWVAAFHGQLFLTPNIRLPSAVDNLIHSGWLAVDLFFVLSGFVISHAHLRDFTVLSGRGVSRFLRLRLARIYPAHLVVALLWLLPLAAARLSNHPFSTGVAQHFNARTFVYAVTLTNGWGFPGSVGWNLPSWSVGSEWFAYLMFPLTACALWRVRTVTSHIIIAAAIMLATISLAYLVNGGARYMLPESFTLVRVESEFLIGCCVYGVYVQKPPGMGAAWIVWTGAIGCVLLACIGQHGLTDGLFIPLFALLVLGLSRRSGILASILAHPWSVHLGKISYSIYLIHGLVILTLRQVPALVGVFGDAHPMLIATIYLSGVIAAGHILYTTVEEPARAQLRRRWKKQRPSMASTSS
jgi:peptidoglycan/LPS O-acetylase OafA/YrhL